MRRKSTVINLLSLLGFGVLIWAAAHFTRPVAVTADETGAIASASETEYVPKTKAQLRKMLTRIQYDVTQNEGTEQAFRNEYWNNKKKGVYKCIVCGRDLFDSETKYKSGTGWPSFYAPLDENSVGIKKDWKLIYTRYEVHCSRCNAHLGHVFDDGPPPTGKRYCMNSAALRFEEKKADEATEK